MHGVSIAIVLLVVGFPAVYSLDCLDANGQPVDWFLAYSYTRSASPDGVTGKEYAYIDSSMTKFFTPGPGGNDLADPDSPVIRTMKQVYDGAKKQDPEVGYVFYNDQEDLQDGKKRPPLCKAEYQGSCNGCPHSKGVAAVDGNGGFWLIHNLPKSFDQDPTTTDVPSFASNFDANAQAFFCMSLDLASMESVAQLMYLTRVNVLHRSDSSLVHSWGLLTGDRPEGRGIVCGDVRDACHAGKAAEFRAATKTLTTAAGTRIKAFGKPPLGPVDAPGRLLYDEVIASSLKSSLIVSTWHNNAAGTLLPQCESAPYTYGVDGITLGNGVEWDNKHDHAKWAITTDSSKRTVCVGDINRDVSQQCKGGMAVCIESPAAWDGFNTWVQDHVIGCGPSSGHVSTT